MIKKNSKNSKNKKFVIILKLNKMFNFKINLNYVIIMNQHKVKNQDKKYFQAIIIKINFKMSQMNIHIRITIQQETRP